MMMKKQLKLSALAAVILGGGGLLFALLNARAAISVSYQFPVKAAARPASAPAPQAAPTQQPTLSPNAGTAAKAEAPTTRDVGVLDQSRQFALGMIETGNDDREIGCAGEVSRYQIMPVVWRQFSDSQRYRDPAISQQVAQQLWATLYARFKEQAHRKPTDFDMYVLWNTRYGYYSSKGFNPKKLGPTVRDRAQRFVNLVEHADHECEENSGVAKS